MRNKPKIFVVIVDFPGNDWPVGKPMVLNQYDADLKEMWGQSKGRTFWEHKFKKYPGVYKEITNE